jgi:hypothetical protein
MGSLKIRHCYKARVRRHSCTLTAVRTLWLFSGQRGVPHFWNTSEVRTQPEAFKNLGHFSVCMYVCVCVCVCMYVCIMYVCMYVCMHACMYVLCVCVCVCECIYIQTVCWTHNRKVTTVCRHLSPKVSLKSFRVNLLCWVSIICGKPISFCSEPVQYSLMYYKIVSLITYTQWIWIFYMCKINRNKNDRNCFPQFAT